ncbi:MAG: DUF2252 domain-containing protein [Gordonia sp. (in: high G+C Gram-positive bacteria)]
MSTSITASEDLAAVPEPGSRRDPVEILQDQAITRLPDLVPVRYGRMAATPFTFFRGAAAIMAADLASTPESGIHTQLCGDTHLSNFGLFFTPERRMAFDLNDFDETHPGPFEWDVKRLVASFAVACRNNGFRRKDTTKIVREVARTYRAIMIESAGRSALECWYAKVDADELVTALGERLDTAQLTETRKALKKARHRNSMQALSQLCHIDADGTPHIRYDPPLMVPLDILAPGGAGKQIFTHMTERFAGYATTLAPSVATLFSQYTLLEIARKVVGVGSVGNRSWIALFQGADHGDPLFLQMKEAQPSVLAPYVPEHPFGNQGERVVRGQQLMQAASDIFLGWKTTTELDGTPRDYYVRQLRDGKGSVVVEALSPEGMRYYARMCGGVLAQAHGRSPERRAIAEHLDAIDDFDKAMTRFALAYADITDADHAALTDAIDRGIIRATDLG